MWQKVLDSIRLIFNVGEELRRSRETIERLERENQQFSTALQLMARELEYLRNEEKSEREKLELRCKLALSEFKNQQSLKERE